MKKTIVALGVFIIAGFTPLAYAGCVGPEIMGQCEGMAVPFDTNQQHQNDDIGIGPHRRLDEGNPRHWGQTGLTAHGKWDSDPRDDEGIGIGPHRRLNSGDPTHWGQWE